MRRRERPDDATFERLVREHHAAVYGSALGVLGRDADAQDVTQAVFLSLLEGRIAIEEPGRARPVLRWHAVRVALTQRRSASRRKRREEAGVPRETRSPDEVVQAEDERASLWRELLALPDDQRIPLVLRFAESMTFAEVGAALGIAQPPPRWIQIFVPAGPRWNTAQYDPDTGRFALAGLAPGTHTLRVQPQGWMEWSPVGLAVESGTSDLVVTLKRASDPRDVGDHDAELHGRLLDSASGEPIACEVGEGVETLWSPQPPAGDLERGFLPNHLWPAPRQTAWPPETGVDPYRVPDPTSDFHLTGPDAGRYLVHHHLPGRARGVIGPFPLGEREVRAGLEVRSEPAHLAYVRVLDNAGEPVQGAWVFFTGTGPYSDRRVAGLDAAYREVDGRGTFHGGGGRRTDAAGTSRHEHLPAGAHLRIGVVHPDFQPHVGPLLEFAPDGRTATISVALEPP